LHEPAVDVTDRQRPAEIFEYVGANLLLADTQRLIRLGRGFGLDAGLQHLFDDLIHS